MILRAFLTLALCAALLAGPARAQQSTQNALPGYLSTTASGCPSGLACFVPFMGASGVTFAAATVGTGHAQVLAANSTHGYLMLHNPSAAGGNTVYCSIGGTATVAGAGTLSIAPGQYVSQESNSFSILAVDCIATGSSTPFTIGTN